MLFLKNVTLDIKFRSIEVTSDVYAMAYLIDFAGCLAFDLWM